MTPSEICQRLKEIRSASHCRSQQWLEMELSRVIAEAERDEVNEADYARRFIEAFKSITADNYSP